MKRILFAMICSLFAANANAGLMPVDWYQAVDPATNKPKAIVRIEYFEDQCTLDCMAEHLPVADQTEYYKCLDACYSYFGRIVAF